MPFDDSLLERARAISLVSFDVDGVLTDGQIVYSERGDELKAFNVQDGHAIKMLQSSGIEVAIITGRTSSMVTRRAAELGIAHVFQGSADKVATLLLLIERLGIAAAAVAHVGDDLPDLPLFGRVGLAVGVPNGHPAALAATHYVTSLSGGQGVAREVCELLLRAQGRWPFG
jgi:3-deoxy-D-manno-octulosonate 8-phosphate phosphatase (KDO 8-P phosphatase)